jgi:cation-transporting ATPase 13A2
MYSNTAKSLSQKSPIELGVLKSFDFVSQLRRASVIARNFGSQGGDVYVKGAPECMKDICRAESCMFHDQTHVGKQLTVNSSK